MKIFRGEVRVWRIVLVEAANSGVAEEHGSTSIRLETMLVRVNDDRVGVRDGVKGSARFGVEVGDKREVASISGIDMNAEAVSLSELENPVERIDRSDGRRTKRDDYRADVTACQRLLKRDNIHSSGIVRRNAGER